MKLQASSFKFEGSSFKLQASSLKLQAASVRLQVLPASRPKLQAASFKMQVLHTSRLKSQAASFKLKVASLAGFALSSFKLEVSASFKLSAAIISMKICRGIHLVSFNRISRHLRLEAGDLKFETLGRFIEAWKLEASKPQASSLKVQASNFKL